MNHFKKPLTNETNLKRVAEFILANKDLIVIKNSSDPYRIQKSSPNNLNSYNKDVHNLRHSCLNIIGISTFIEDFYPLNHEDYWKHYTKRIFGISFSDRSYVEIIDWLFNEKWNTIDSSSEGTAYRILYYIENGVPKNYKDMLNGKTPINYLPEKYGAWIAHNSDSNKPDCLEPTDYVQIVGVTNSNKLIVDKFLEFSNTDKLVNIGFESRPVSSTLWKNVVAYRKVNF